ncbi:MAG: putative Holliday junction resolvase [Flavobacteriales bacterium]|jgi:putative Holliday junction resolvase
MIATPVETVDARPRPSAIARICALIEENAITQLVYGLPLELSGNEGQAVRRVRVFQKAVSEACDLPFAEWDERMSSVAAERSLIESGVRRAGRKKVIDQVAATLILQGWLDLHRTERR